MVTDTESVEQLDIGDGGAPGGTLGYGDGGDGGKRRGRPRRNRDSESPATAEAPRAKSAAAGAVDQDVAKTLTVGSRKIARTFGAHWTFDKEESQLLAGAISEVGRDMPGMPSRFALAGKAAWLALVAAVIMVPRILETKALMAQRQAQLQAVQAEWSMAQQQAQAAQQRNGYHAAPAQPAQPDPLTRAEAPGPGSEELLRRF